MRFATRFTIPSRSSGLSSRTAQRFPILQPDGPLPDGVIHTTDIAAVQRLVSNEVCAVVWRSPQSQALISEAALLNVGDLAPNRSNRHDCIWPNSYQADAQGWLHTHPYARNTPSRGTFDDEEGELLGRISLTGAQAVLEEHFNLVSGAICRAGRNTAIASRAEIAVCYPGYNEPLHFDFMPRDSWVQALTPLTGQGVWIAPSLSAKNDHKSFAESPDFTGKVFEVALGDTVFFRNDLLYSFPTNATPDKVNMVAMLQPYRPNARLGRPQEGLRDWMQQWFPPSAVGELRPALGGGAAMSGVP